MNSPSKMLFGWVMKAILASAIILLLALAACKAPTSIVSPQSNPTISLNAPDTVFWGDSCIMTASISDTTKQGRELKWLISDSTSISGTDSILHYFLTPGIDTVTVTLLDTVHHLTLATRLAIVHVFARHFNLALLQSMKFVDVSWQVPTDTVRSGSSNVPPNDPTSFSKGITWNGQSFSMQAYTEYALWDTLSQGIYGDSSSSSASIAGSVDSSLTSVSMNQGDNFYSFDGPEFPGQSSLSDGTNSFGCTDIPFAYSNDTEIVFKANEYLHNYASSSFVFANSALGEGSVQTNTNWSKAYPSSFVPYVIIRFHN